MRRRLTALAGLTMAVALVLPGPATIHAAGPDLSPRVIASLPSGPYGSFGESLAVSGGNLYVSLTTWSPDESSPNEGQVWKIGPNGKPTRFGPRLDVCLMTGLAFGADGALYAGTYSCGVDFTLASGVLRINPDGTATRVATLPAGSFPNGLAFHGGDLYISDSASGAIWRVRPQGDANLEPGAPWLQTPLLAPRNATGLGANGIAFRNDTLYAVNASTGAVVSVPLRPDGSAGSPALVVRTHALVEADGIAFDSRGDLWITVNSGALARVTRIGEVQVIVSRVAWLDYPAQPVFGATGPSRGTLFVVNGSYLNGVPNVIALEVG